MSAKISKRRNNAVARQGNKCFFCGIEMLPAGETIDGKRMHPQSTTLEHVYPKMSKDRGKHGGKIVNVACCWQCNQDRGAAFMAALPIEILRKLGKLGHRKTTK